MSKILVLNDKKIDYLTDLIGEVYIRNPEESAYFLRDVAAVLDYIINTESVEVDDTESVEVDDPEDNDWK